MRASFVAALAAAFIVGAAAPSLAAERDATPQERERVLRHLASLGYSAITDVDVVGARFEVDARSPQGRDVDVILDMDTLAVLREEDS